MQRLTRKLCVSCGLRCVSLRPEPIPRKLKRKLWGPDSHETGQGPHGHLFREWGGALCSRYKAVESEAASMLLVSTLALAITVPKILWLSH